MAAMAYPCRLAEGLGRFRTLTEAEEIAQSVRLILTTRQGERPYRPDFGARLDRFAFENNETTTQNLIRQEVVVSLQTWEPRVEDIEVDFDYRPEEGILLANVSYRVRLSGAPGRLTVSLTSR